MTVYTELFELNATIFIQIINIILAMTLMILPLAAAILLQIHLCKKENKWFGLILPVLSGIFSLFTLFSSVAFILSEQSGFRILLGICILYFVAMNIPTLVFVLIYRSCRKKYRIKKEMNKMNIQDLD